MAATAYHIFCNPHFPATILLPYDNPNNEKQCSSSLEVSVLHTDVLNALPSDLTYRLRLGQRGQLLLPETIQGSAQI